MISVLINGKVVKQPRTGNGSGGSTWCSASIRCPVQGAKADEQDSVLVSLIAFDEQADKLSRLGVGDAISATGSAKMNQWERDGVVYSGLAVTATGILSAYETRKRKGEHGGEGRPKGFEAYAKQMSPNTPRQTKDFDDPISFGGKYGNQTQI